MTIGSRLKKLRVENNYSQRQIAEYLEIDQSNLSKIENNKRNLNWTLSDKLLSLYNCSLEYLLGQTDYYKKPEISFKSGRDIDLNAISKINKLSYELQVLRKLEEGESEVPKLPKLNINLKRQWGLDEYSPIDIFNILPQKIPNLTIVWFPMKRSVRGACFKNKIDSIILINSALSKGSQNLALAHELYHLLNDDEKTEPEEEKNIFIISPDTNIHYEKEAEEFASSFLMSDNALYDFIERNNIEKWTIEDLIRCEVYFQLDHNNLTHRLIKEGMIDEDMIDEDIIKKAASLGYDTSLYQKTHEEKAFYSIGHMIPLTENLYKHDKITKGRRDDILLEFFREDIVY